MVTPLSEKLAQLRSQAKEDLANCQTPSLLEKIRIKYLGRKGELTQLLKSLKNLPLEERKKIGQEANEFKAFLTNAILDLQEKLKSIEGEKRFFFDYTLPGRWFWLGHKHPLTQIMEECIKIFVGMGFKEELGPEIEDEWHNFTALNIPPEHPARDMFSTFYLEGNKLLRAHTSPGQIRIMSKKKPPIRVIVPGRVFRRDDFDASHSPVFHQIEGLCVDTDVTFLDLKGTLECFCQLMFGESVSVKFVPSYFPFTEPSAEVAISCIICSGRGCQTCQGSGFLEILGCGMVHPQVFINVNIDPEKYTGYAFGLGIERIAMIKCRIDDIRLFYDNDIRFLNQF